jgi:hypothetical protein
MAPKKKLVVIPLSPGIQMVSEIIAEMLDAGVQPDAKENALLAAACSIVDRLSALEALILRDGELIDAPNGMTRVHPAVSEYRQYAATLPKVLAGIVIGDSASGVAKNPVKQRAANARWDRVARDNQSQKKLAGL